MPALGTRLNAWDVLPLQVYCASWISLVLDGYGYAQPRLSAVKV